MLSEQRLAQEQQIHPAAEDHRRAQRRAQLAARARTAGRAVSSLRLCAREATQRSVKFIRWLRQALRERLTEDTAAPRLRLLYASL